jgi:hypothetical protein
MAKSLNLSPILKKHGAKLLEEWSKELGESSKKDRRLNSAELRKQARELLENIQEGAANGNVTDLERPEWESVNSFLEEISRSRALQGFDSDEIARWHEPRGSSSLRGTGHEVRAAQGSVEVEEPISFLHES